MAKIYYPAPCKRTSLPDFIEAMEPKLRQKLYGQLALLSSVPSLGEPHVKHFTIEKYNRLYELRARSRIMVRIIFAYQNDGSILLLSGFIKRHKRNTMQALDASAILLSEIDSGLCPIRELRPGPQKSCERRINESCPNLCMKGE